MKGTLIHNTLRFLLLTALVSCNEKANFEAITNSPTEAVSGDIIIVSGGTVAATATPFPLHKIALFSSKGSFKRFLYQTPNALEFLYGGDIDPVTGDLVFGVENIDRLLRVNLGNFEVDNDILDANLSGATVRAVAVLNDGSRLVAESPTIIEKFSAAGVRSGAPFPLTIPTAINGINRISGDRWIVSFTGNPDSPRVYNANGTLVATFASAVGACTTNCDPFSVVELPDGRFVMSGRVTNGLYLYSNTFAYIGVLYLNTSVIQQPSALAVLKNGNLLACGTNFNSCEELVISGNTATRVGSRALIDNASVMRQPTAAIVIP